MEIVQTPPVLITNDDKNVDLLDRFISTRYCVLLLGPLFGIDNNNDKISSGLRSYLTQPPNNFDLDDEYDSLYISKSSDGSQSLLLINEISKFFEQVQPNEIYDRILKIGFRAIITYSSDLLLANANKSEAYDFYYFSTKGNKKPEDEAALKQISQKAVIYNLFGNNSDFNSLITDYDSLYDFLISIVKADQEFPLQLKNILSNAKAFLFLGFDLSKWYIPLLVRKLNQFILNGNRLKNNVLAFSCLDDTPVMNPKTVTDSLNKYPLVFRPFEHLNSLELLSRLYQKAEGRFGKEKKSGEKQDVTPAQKEFFGRWLNATADYGQEAWLSAFFQEFKTLNLSGTLKTNFDLQGMQFKEKLTQKMIPTISEETFIQDCNKIIISVRHFINEVLA
jgi:hypothetical protein